MVVGVLVAAYALTKYQIHKLSIISIKNMTVCEVVREALKKSEVLRDDVGEVDLVALGVNVINAAALLGVLRAGLAQLVRHYNAVYCGSYRGDNGDNGYNGGGFQAAGFQYHPKRAGTSYAVLWPQILRYLYPVRVY